MTAMVSGDRAKAAGLTGVAGSLILAGAVVMMAVAAPSTPHPQHAGPKAATRVATLAVTDQRKLVRQQVGPAPLASAAVS